MAQIPIHSTSSRVHVVSTPVIQYEKALPVVKGDQIPQDERDAWGWLQNPIPPGDEDPNFAALRLQLGIPPTTFVTDRGFGSLDFLEKETIGQTLSPGFYKEHNPIIRHTILRRRQTLEDAGLLERVGVDVHPDPSGKDGTYTGVGFQGLGLLTNHPFNLAYDAAEKFTILLNNGQEPLGS